MDIPDSPSSSHSCALKPHMMLLWFICMSLIFLSSMRYFGCKVSIFGLYLGQAPASLCTAEPQPTVSSFWLVFRKEGLRCNTDHPKVITCLAKLPKQTLVSHVIPSIMLSIVRRGCAPGVEVRIAAYVKSSMQRYRLDKVGGFSLVPHATLSPFSSTSSCLNVTQPPTRTHT